MPFNSCITLDLVCLCVASPGVLTLLRAPWQHRLSNQCISLRRHSIPSSSCPTYVSPCQALYQSTVELADVYDHAFNITSKEEHVKMRGFKLAAEAFADRVHQLEAELTALQDQAAKADPGAPLPPPTVL